MDSPIKEGPLQPGDHLRVRRPVGYYHHGIYTGERTVVQFGGRVLDKRHAKIDEVPLSCFADGGTPQRVDHSQLNWLLAGWKLPPALPPDITVARARCLAASNIEGAYNLFGNNCETVALWCVCGFGESLQCQKLNTWKVFVGVPLTLAFAFGVRRKQIKRAHIWIIGGITIANLAESIMYLAHNRRFYRDAKPCEQC